MQSSRLGCTLFFVMACSCTGAPSSGRAFYVPQVSLPKVPQAQVSNVPAPVGVPQVPEQMPQETQASAPTASFDGATMTSPSMMAPGAMIGVPVVGMPTALDQAQPAPYDAFPMQTTGEMPANTVSSFFAGLAAGFAAVAAVVYATMKKNVDVNAVEVSNMELGMLPSMASDASRMQPVTMQLFGGKRASPTKPVVKKGAKPLSPGSNYPTTKNIQKQASGFGTFLQKFQKADGKSKYGMPIFLPNGNVNPAYLAAERKEMAATKKKNIQASEQKRKGLIAAGNFELADYVRKKIGNVGSGKEYYESGR